MPSTSTQNKAETQAPISADSAFPGAVLLLASAAAAACLAPALRSELDCEVCATDDPVACEALMRDRGFGFILLEDCVPSSQPAFAESVYRHAGSAIVLEVNFGIANAIRVVRAIRGAHERRRLEVAAARTEALQSLRNELSSCLTGLLLESELALHSNRSELAPALSNLIALGELLYRQVRP